MFSILPTPTASTGASETTTSSKKKKDDDVQEADIEEE
jgi:hypothetical protein